jgi:proteasome lid subunit RPN8/RPN11
MLLGRFRLEPPPVLKIVVEVWQAENAWSPEVEELFENRQDRGGPQNHSAVDRYWIAPEFLLRAQQYARDHDLAIIGIYHSHPNHSAHPSNCDRVRAWAHYSYLIVSVQQGIADDYRSWMLDEAHLFQPEPILTE